MPVRVIVTAVPLVDYTQAEALIKDLPAEFLLADKGYDTDAIAEGAQARGMQVVIPPRSNRNQPRQYDTYLYKLRHPGGECLPAAQVMAWHRRPSAPLPFWPSFQLRCALLFGPKSHDDTL